MTIDYLETPEEIIFDQLVDKEWDLLSEAGLTVLRTALGAAYKAYLVHSCSYQSPEEEDDMKAMRLAAAEFTEHDFEGLTKIWRSALAAAASVDPYDYETLVKHKVTCADLHEFYRMVASKVEGVEREKRLEELRNKQHAEREPVDAEDPPFLRQHRDQKVASKRKDD
jgi:hypothetical protein